ncbi:ABC transporter ATP-binding protein [Phaeobacter sp. B1627]|uniref:ABC transporter ATP-binding protein n=1 Tax=Phaeobacter sp. B1627 TaxID=2583809 RepID=UPI00111AF0E2|nr:ABC transporter ATP-binding protein [Phaeobacter sp. B1627]TNJ40602.1 ABC transporter ATP-binding protein [Phaeobacter sp. B1627]
MTVSLTLENITAHYGKTMVLEDLDLHVGEGELVSLLGSSGCGKTTTLRLVAGFLEPTSGRIRLGERDLTRLPSHARDIGLVFQTYALFPHLSVRDNVAFGLKQRGIATSDRNKRAMDMIERVGLSGFADRYPANLSGGQRQRVALARALVIDPPLLMFDEPLSNLDAKLRVEMRVEIRRLQQANGTTALYVTHDQEEAFSISDRVAIMNKGRIMQLDTPEVLYSRPANAFVADFVGFENVIEAVATGEEGGMILAEAGGAQLKLPKSHFELPAKEFLLAARADGLLVAETGEGLPATLGLRTYLGRAYQYVCETRAGNLTANGPLGAPLETGANAVLIPQPEQCCVLHREAR